ncbi:MAG: helix-turn-helix domain-containing protein [Caldicoprobacterales bacterium]|jgi:uncharacterized protein YpbB|nr:hypothetical protein [Clostridiales bacterium]
MLRCYVVLKTVEKIHGKRGKTFVVKLLRGSREYSVEKAVHDFDLVPLWGLLSRLSREEVEALLTEQMEKGWAYIEEVTSGGYTFPFLHISEDGRERLNSLEEAQGNELTAHLEQVCFLQKSPEISDKGIQLDHFLSQLIQLLQMWSDHSFDDMGLTELIGYLNLEFSAAEMLEKFLFRSTPDKLQDQFRSPYVLDMTCYQLSNQIRQLLSAFPEQESMVFRCRYGLTDRLHQPLISLMKHYGLTIRDVQYTVKRCISYFANRSYLERYPLVAAIHGLLAESLGEDPSTPLSLVKDTAQVTYELYQNNLSVHEIARERGLAVSTIFAHFSRLIPKYKLNLNEILSEERIAGILQAADTTGGVSLKAVREQLPSDYNYGEIKLVLELERGWKAA